MPSGMVQESMGQYWANTSNTTFLIRSLNMADYKEEQK